MYSGGALEVLRVALAPVGGLGDLMVGTGVVLGGPGEAAGDDDDDDGEVTHGGGHLWGEPAPPRSVPFTSWASGARCSWTHLDLPIPVMDTGPEGFFWGHLSVPLALSARRFSRSVPVFQESQTLLIPSLLQKRFQNMEKIFVFLFYSFW